MRITSLTQFVRLGLYSISALLLTFTLFVWLTWFSPLGYVPPDNLPYIEDKTHHVFVFGTLKSPWVRLLVMGRMGEAEPEQLPGMRRDGLNVVPDPSHSTPGYVIRVTAEELARLDYYERVGVRYERIQMLLKDGRVVWVYRRLSN